MKMFAPLGFIGGLSDSQMEAIAKGSQARSASLPTLEQAVEAGSWLVGTPEDITEQLMQVQKHYPGLTDINVLNSLGTPEDVMLEQMERFGKEIIPNFKA
jgi:alkanesulfonate monooxygenase SsuD/methylene tetrahydromethanopterin reductase-like flavin-dependent oxidoreductase (luciferase family)